MSTKDDVEEVLLSDTKKYESPSFRRIRSRRQYYSNNTIVCTPSADINCSDQQIYNGADFAKRQISIAQVIVVWATYLGGGTLCFFLIRDQIEGHKTNGFLDAMYFCVVTMTTVGYGDLVPSSILAKLLASIYVFIGLFLGGLIVGKVADYIVEKQEILLVRAIHVSEEIGPVELLKEMETNKVKYKFFTAMAQILVLIIVGTVFLHVVENLEFMDAFYCVCSTITTLGYGDESFSTEGGRVFGIFWILGSTICLAQFFVYLAELYTETRQKSLIKWVLNRKFTDADLEAADLDQDEVVSMFGIFFSSAAEFVLYKLKEMGKIGQEDISMLMETFEQLDIDQSGSLTPADLLRP
ncbi:two-pore potassium channel 1-like [Humulus lupulus]|uniref:two-pore potassium channel 1-like n=1 Tax=Humulus lupulus TaxID=3486 RepID=UPI002B4166D2|nr:two-pore potassium channel 1-like [Humulus lupulus]